MPHNSSAEADNLLLYQNSRRVSCRSAEPFLPPTVDSKLPWYVTEAGSAAARTAGVVRPLQYFRGSRYRLRSSARASRRTEGSTKRSRGISVVMPDSCRILSTIDFSTVSGT